VGWGVRTGSRINRGGINCRGGGKRRRRRNEVRETSQPRRVSTSVDAGTDAVKPTDGETGQREMGSDNFSFEVLPKTVKHIRVCFICFVPTAPRKLWIIWQSELYYQLLSGFCLGNFCTFGGVAGGAQYILTHWHWHWLTCSFWLVTNSIATYALLSWCWD